MSDTQQLTPALSTPERDLLRREIYKGLADRAAGRVKDLDVDAIFAKGKELLQKRSISNVRQFGVDGRKTLLFSSSFRAPRERLLRADAAAASRRTCVRARAADGGEEIGDPLFARRIRRPLRGDAARSGPRSRRRRDHQDQGDAGGSIYWLCYRRAQHQLWVVSSGEMGGPPSRHRDREELTEKDTDTSTDCAIIPEKFSPLVFDGKLHLGMSRQEVITAFGPPSKSEAAQIVYSHDGKLADGFDETAWLILRFREEKLVSMRGGKTTTN